MRTRLAQPANRGEANIPGVARGETIPEDLSPRTSHVASGRSAATISLNGYRLASPLAGADMRGGVDLDLQRRIRERGDLHQRRAREVAGEKFAAGLPH